MLRNDPAQHSSHFRISEVHIMDASTRRGKPERIEIPVLSLFFGLTFFLFPITEVYLINPFEFNLDTPHALIPALLIALTASAAVCLLLMLLKKIHPYLGKAGILAVFGITLAGYIQNLFWNEKLGTIDGHLFDKWITQSYRNINWTVMVVIAVTPVMCFLLSLQKKDSRPAKLIRSTKPLLFICMTIILMQTAGCISYLPNLRQENRKDSYGSYLSFAPARDLSKEQNIVVFIFDRMDCQYMDQVLNAYPEVGEILDGFTYYRNNISNYLFTYPSVPTMLTGCPYNGLEQHFDHFNRIWHSDSNIVRKLHENGFRNYLIPDDYTTYATVDRLEGITDNITKSEETPHYRWLGEGGIFRTELHLALLKTLPYNLKQPHSTGADFDSFLIYDKAMPDKSTPFASAERDLAYRDYLFSNGLTSDSPQKTFTFIHLNCAHDPDARLAAMYPGYEPEPVDSEYTTVRGEFTVIEKYMDELKRLGIYDCTTFLILGDHGRYPGELNPTDPGELDTCITTALLIKPANAPHAPLQTDNTAEMCNGYFSASVMEYAGLPHSDYGLSFDDVIRDHPQTERALYLDFDKQPYYTIRGDAYDFAGNWTFHPQE